MKLRAERMWKSFRYAKIQSAIDRQTSDRDKKTTEK